MEKNLIQKKDIEIILKNILIEVDNGFEIEGYSPNFDFQKCEIYHISKLEKEEIKQKMIDFRFKKIENLDEEEIDIFFDEIIYFSHFFYEEKEKENLLLKLENAYFKYLNTDFIVLKNVEEDEEIIEYYYSNIFDLVKDIFNNKLYFFNLTTDNFLTNCDDFEYQAEKSYKSKNYESLKNWFWKEFKNSFKKDFIKIKNLILRS